MRCLGVVIYPDGSQAEVWEESWITAFIHGPPKIGFRPLKRPRKLTFAPYFLIAVLSFALPGCVHLQRVGDKPICLLDYDTGIKHCVYDDWKACHEDLQRNTICYRR